MKTSNRILKILAVILLFLFNSCIDHYSISTKINADGSLDRTIQVVADDSTSVFEGNLKIPSDTSWKISTRWIYSVEGDTTSEKKFEYTASKHFSNIHELNKYLTVVGDTTTFIKISGRLEKKFRWFYTYYSYAETYQKSFPFNQFSPDKFINENELSYFYDDKYIYVKEKDSLVHLKDLDKIPVLNHQDSLRMEDLGNNILKKLSTYIGKSIYEEYYQYLLTELKTLDNAKYQYLLKNKDSIYSHSRLSDALTDLKEQKGDPFETINQEIGLSTDSVEKLNPSAFKPLNTKIENTINLFFDDQKIRNEVSLPGELLNTNADSISRGIAYWNYNEHYFFLSDYRLLAESRTINRWTFYLTGIIAVALGLSLITTLISRKKS
jgi:hypothetical protein